MPQQHKADSSICHLLDVWEEQSSSSSDLLLDGVTSILTKFCHRNEPFATFWTVSFSIKDTESGNWTRKVANAFCLSFLFSSPCDSFYLGWDSDDPIMKPAASFNEMTCTLCSLRRCSDCLLTSVTENQPEHPIMVTATLFTQTHIYTHWCTVWRRADASACMCVCVYSWSDDGIPWLKDKFGTAQGPV